MISNRYAEANNKYTDKGFDETKDKSYITYMDANGLYATIMRDNKLPTGGFRFWTDDEIRDRYSDFSESKIEKDSDIGYFLEVDLDYPPELHDKHNDYPLAPEKMTVTDDMRGSDAFTFPDRPKPSEKLVPNLNDKKNYGLHYENLKLYLKLGMQLKEIHRVLEFKQSAWMETYVRLCSQNRIKANTQFEKDFWKLCI